MKPPRPLSARWLTIREASEVLSMTPEALRRSIERHALRAPDGGVEAVIDGVRARRFGRLWRVSFSERWTLEPLVELAKVGS